MIHCLPLAGFGFINWSVVVLYLLAMIAIGHLHGRKKMNAEGYFLGERSVPIFAVVLSTIAAMLSGATFVSVPDSSANGDLTYLVLNVGGFLAILLVGTLFVPRFYRAGTITIYGFLRQRFGEEARVACSGMFIIGRILASGARLFIVAIPISQLLFDTADEPRKHLIVLAILMVGCIGIAYTVAGGIKAVIWTDTAQIIVVVGAALMSIGLLLHAIPRSLPEIVQILNTPGTGLDGGSKLKVVDTSFSLTREYTLLVALLASMPLQLAAYGTDHDMVQRMLTAKSAARGGASAILAQVLSVFVVSLFLIIGLLLYIFYKRPDVMGWTPHDPVKAGVALYPQFLRNHVPVGLAGIAMAGLFAVAQGSLDSAINAMASSLVADFYWPLRQLRGLPVDQSSSRAPRVAVVIMGATLICFAIGCVFLYDFNAKSPGGLLSFALGIMSFAYSGMLAVFLTALFTRRGNSASVLAALVVGFLVVALFQKGVMLTWTKWFFGKPYAFGTFWSMPIGTVISFLICIAGTPTRRPTPDAEHSVGAARIATP